MVTGAGVRSTRHAVDAKAELVTGPRVFFSNSQRFATCTFSSIRKRPIFLGISTLLKPMCATGHTWFRSRGLWESRWIRCQNPRCICSSRTVFELPQGAFAVHGISNQFAEANGVPLQPVLNRFVEVVNNATTVVAHNLSFDMNIIGAACARAGIPNPIRGKKTRCTMQESTSYCRLPSRRRGYKWPTLTELHRKLFDLDFGNAHDAAEDTVACMKCFFRLQELKVM